MTNIIVELESTDYERLEAEATRLGKTPDSLIQEWVAERLQKPQPEQLSDNELAVRALKEAGLLTELSPELKKLANPTMTREEVEAALSRDGVSLSQIVIDGRGPKD